MIDKSNTDVPEFGTKVMTLILGILNVDCRVEHTITQIDGDKITPIINPNDDTGNDRLQINIPNVPGIQIFPGEITHPGPAPWEQRVWYNQESEPEPIQSDAAIDVRYTTSVFCTGDKNCITTTYNPNDVQYTGDFRDVQTSFNDK